jgi:hypothetical protein
MQARAVWEARAARACWGAACGMLCRPAAHSPGAPAGPRCHGAPAHDGAPAGPRAPPPGLIIKLHTPRLQPRRAPGAGGARGRGLSDVFRRSSGGSGALARAPRPRRLARGPRGRAHCAPAVCFAAPASPCSGATIVFVALAPNPAPQPRAPQRPPRTFSRVTGAHLDPPHRQTPQRAPRVAGRRTVPPVARAAPASSRGAVASSDPSVMVRPSGRGGPSAARALAACLLALLAAAQGAAAQGAAAKDVAAKKGSVEVDTYGKPKVPKECPPNCLACGESESSEKAWRRCRESESSWKACRRSGSASPRPRRPPTFPPGAARMRGRRKKKIANSGRRLQNAPYRTVCTLCDTGYAPNKAGTKCGECARRAARGRSAAAAGSRQQRKLQRPQRQRWQQQQPVVSAGTRPR